MTTPAQTRRWWVMVVLGIAELMTTLDDSIVTIALPSAQTDLGFDAAHRSWIITAYALAFGSLLLLGGRLTDLAGRKRAFLIGLIGFATASILGGLAPNFAILVTARGLQGAFAALLAPAALSLLTTTFPEGRDRARAFGVFATLAVSGAAIGMLLGGVLTEYVDWRWCLFVNALFAAVAFLGATVLLPAERSESRPRLDVPGTVTAAAGLFCLVYGFANTESHGWATPEVAGSLAAAVALLGAFVLIQRSVRAPLLPLRLVLDRYRGGSFLTCFVALIGMFAVILFLTYVLQQQLHFTPLLTGLAFLPMVGCVMITANTVPAVLLPLTGPRTLLTTGLMTCAGALFWLSFLTSDATYAVDILGPLMLMGLGMGTAISTSINTATAGIDPADAGTASAAVNAVQQIGGSVGAALLSSIAISAAASVDAVPTGVAMVHGYASAFAIAAAVFLGAAITVGALVPAQRGAPRRDPEPSPPTSEPLELADSRQPAGLPR